MNLSLDLRSFVDVLQIHAVTFSHSVIVCKSILLSLRVNIDGEAVDVVAVVALALAALGERNNDSNHRRCSAGVISSPPSPCFLLYS